MISSSNKPEHTIALLQATQSQNPHCPFAFAALAALFLLLLIMTTLKKLPTTAPPRRRRMTGMRMAQTRGGKRDWMKWESSTKGCSEC
jgi:hypothetical protein